MWNPSAAETHRRFEPAARVEPAPPDARAVPSSPTICVLQCSRIQRMGESAKPKRSFGRWALGAASVAACVAIGIGILSLSPGRIDRSLQAIIRGLDTQFETRGLSIRGSTDGEVRFGAGLFPSECAGRRTFPTPSPDSDSSSSSDGEINTVIVQPGETLRQVILRTMGEYNGDTIEQIRKLNPDIADLDHLKRARRFDSRGFPLPLILPQFQRRSRQQRQELSN